MVAQTLLTPNTTIMMQSMLPNFNGNLSAIASWADQVRDNGTYPWNRPLHCALTPWWSGQYIRSRDCWANKTTEFYPDGCVDGAIQNYTSRAMSCDLDFKQRQEALMYIVHFIGDLHQPLHGGFWEDYSADKTRGYWFGPTGYGPAPNNITTLHSIWDSQKAHIMITMFLIFDIAVYISIDIRCIYSIRSI